jgi:hypothetical protein
MRQWRALLHRVAVSVISVLALTVVLGGFAAIPAVQAASQVSRAAPVPVIPGRTATIPGIPGGLDAVSATSATNAWAAGTQTLASGHVGTLFLHWNGTAWSQVKTPNPGPGIYYPSSVSADSPTDAWATGLYCTTTNSCDVEHTLILHWNGTAWSKVASPSPGPARNGLNGVTAISPTDAWAVGGYCAPHACPDSTTLILHWNGTAWSRVTSPDPGAENGLGAVSATTPSNVWAVGFDDADALTLHWNGTAWSETSG